MTIAEPPAPTDTELEPRDAFPLEIEVEPQGAKVVLRIIGYLDHSTTATLWSCLEGLDPQFREVTIDLSRMSFMDSSGLGQLVHARRTFATDFRTLRLRNPSDHARFVFELTGLADHIDGGTQPHGSLESG